MTTIHDYKTDDPYLRKLVELLIAEADADGKCKKNLTAYTRDLAFPGAMLTVVHRELVLTKIITNGWDDHAVMVKLVDDAPPVDLETFDDDLPDGFDEHLEAWLADQVVPDDPSPAPERPANPRSVPRPGVETRTPADQNSYVLAVVNSKQLGATAKLAVMIAAVEFGLEAFKCGKSFGEITKELTPEYMAGKMNMGTVATRTAMTAATKLGFLVRTDNAAGGRGNINRATYRPALPTYL